MVEMKDLREVAEELNIKLDLTPKIRKVGISRGGIIEQILDAAELILPSDDITDFTNEVLKGLKEPKQEKKTEIKKEKDKVKVKVDKKKINKSNKYDLMFKKVKVNKTIEKVRYPIEDDNPDIYNVFWDTILFSESWEGWVIGYRKKFEGTYDTGDFKRSNTVNCILVVKNAISNPISVPMDGFEVIE